MPTLKCFKAELVPNQEEKKPPHIILSTYLKKPNRGGRVFTKPEVNWQALWIDKSASVGDPTRYVDVFGITSYISMSTESYHNTTDAGGRPTFQTKGLHCLTKKRIFTVALAITPERYMALKSTAADKQTPVIAKVISVHRSCAAKTK